MTKDIEKNFIEEVSTHSRPKAAGLNSCKILVTENVSTHSRPKAAGIYIRRRSQSYPVSTHSRPKAAGILNFAYSKVLKFQHTAARRRLGLILF